MANKNSLKSIWQALNQKPMLLALLMGFAAGLPFMLATKTFQTWVSYTQIDIKTVGLLALVGTPYTLKFVWAPLMDRFAIGSFGRRRGWLLITQAGVIASVIGLSFTNPAEQIMISSLFALLISFFSASQDIAIDAYRRESLTDEQLGLGSSLYSMGYRIAVWVAGGLTLILADHISWNTVYLCMALAMGFCLLVTLWADEPEAHVGAPKTLRDAVILPLQEFFTRKGALLVLVFVLIYKMGDAMAGNLLAKLYAELGYSLTEVGLIAKTMGGASVTLGTFVGGSLIIILGIYRSLYVFGIFQALSTLTFAFLYHVGYHIPSLAGVVFFEDFTSGMGSAAFMAFMASLTNKSFTATQYALLTSLMALPRTFISSAAGYLVEFLGWMNFFYLCTVLAIPGLILIRYVHRLHNSTHKVTNPSA